MYIVDGHCDTLLALMEKNENLVKNNLQIDLEKIKATKSNYLQFYAVFESPSIKGDRAIEDVNKMMSIYEKECKLNDITKILKKDDLLFNGHGALLSIEGLYFLNGKHKKIKELYEKGVRCLSLTWNPNNEFSSGVLGENDKGLLKKGKKVIKKAKQLGILIDVSHISDKGFWDVYNISKNPFIASHSNARAICSHSRNLDNDMLKALKEIGGLTGINMYSSFLNDRGVSDISDIIKHIEHIASIASIDTVGLGTDFDGIPRTQSAIDSPLEVLDIFEKLAKLNYTQDQIEKIAGLNYLRVLDKVLK